MNEEGEASISGLADLTLWTASVSERKRARLSTKMRYHNMATDLELLALMMFKVSARTHSSHKCGNNSAMISYSRTNIRANFALHLTTLMLADIFPIPVTRSGVHSPLRLRAGAPVLMRS